MRPKLEPTDVLRRRGDLQLASLPGRRLLLRHPRGVSVVEGISRADAEAVLAEVDGRRTAEEIVDALAERFETRAAVRLLRRLFGEALSRVPAPIPGRVLVLGQGDAASTLVEELAMVGLESAALNDPAALDERLDALDLIIVALERASYRTLLDVQIACLRASLPSLFVTFDADGVRLGPSVVPGETACFACAQETSFAFLEPEARSSAAEELVTLSARTRDRPVLASAAAEARRLLATTGEPQLLAHVVRFTTAERSTYPVLPSASCPLRCQQISEGGGRFKAWTAAARVEVEEERPFSGVPAREDELVRSIGVLGGGTAGYLAALALRSKLPDLRVTLIESSAVPIIGVGEATTPLMPQFLHADLGIPVGELFREVRPTLKLGIRFLWGPAGGPGFNYPFGTVRPLEAFAYDGHLERCSLRSMMMTRGRVPLFDDGGRTFSRFHTEVAYHLDNARFVRYLKGRARQAGVEHLDAMVRDVEVSENGEEIRALRTEDGRQLTFDLYLDCTGFRSLLLEKALASPYLSYGKSLFTDRAWVARVPYGKSAGEERIPPYTRAATLRSGWCWSTPQAEEDHRGYVFCSAYSTPEEALDDMRAANPGMGEARLVKFRAGRHQHFFKGNVVALGNAYGFVEPLESTALHMLIRQIGLLVQSFPLRRGDRGLEAILNRKVGGAWDYLSWFLAIHYKFNRRLETAFWRACRDEVDVARHGELLEAFAERGPLSYDRAARQNFEYPDPLWGPEGIDVVLLGQSVATRLPKPRWEEGAWRRYLELCQSALACSVPQEEALRLLEAEPRLLESLASAFRAAGPAFGISP